MTTKWVVFLCSKLWDIFKGKDELVTMLYRHGYTNMDTTRRHVTES